jgi:proteasome assembly chaperone (PAC2) family protein
VPCTPESHHADLRREEGRKSLPGDEQGDVTQGEFILFTIIPDVAAMTKANTPTSLGGYDFGHHEQ